ncbi:MAG: 7-carboxy-7-deazaguanine synthase QueE [Candidatus Bathyarchaeia archaeon]
MDGKKLFGKNEIVGKKYFQGNGGKFLVTSIFFTLQGEGPLAGYPAVFIRLAKCNLNCSFCDTYFDSGDWLSLEEIEQRCLKVVEDWFHGWIPDWVVHGKIALIITGGEPSLQNLMSLTQFFEESFMEIQIESNGILKAELPDDVLLVVSPKCAEKTGKYIKPHWETLQRADCLKFVVSADPESPYHTIPQWALDWKEEHFDKDIYISPMNIYNEEPQAAKVARNSNETSIEQRSTVEEVISFWTPGLLNLEQNELNHSWAANYCMTYGLKLNLQMHLYVGKA